MACKGRTEATIGPDGWEKEGGGAPATPPMRLIWAGWEIPDDPAAMEYPTALVVPPKISRTLPPTVAVAATATTATSPIMTPYSMPDAPLRRVWDRRSVSPTSFMPISSAMPVSSARIVFETATHSHAEAEIQNNMDENGSESRPCHGADKPFSRDFG